MDKNKQSFIYYYLLTHFLILFIAIFLIYPTQLIDTIYYWTWSKHLAASYLDGPPMIAYLIYATTHVLGDRIVSFNILAFILFLCSASIVYHISRLFADRKTALTITALWAFYPSSTIRFLLMDLTLDNVEVLFSLLIIYQAACYIKTKNTRYLYCLGFSAGLGLLAKYNTLFLILAILLYFAYNKTLRDVFCNKAFYSAIIIALLLFSPVLMWNYQHHWASFIYQLTCHTHDKKILNKGILFYLRGPILSTLWFWLIILFYFYTQKIRISQNKYTRFLLSVAGIILLSWLLLSHFAHIGLNYTVTADSLIIIVIGYTFLQSDPPRFMLYSILMLFMALNVITIIKHAQLLHPENRHTVHAFSEIYCRPDSNFNCGLTVYYSLPTERLRMTRSQ